MWEGSEGDLELNVDDVESCPFCNQSDALMDIENHADNLINIIKESVIQSTKNDQGADEVVDFLLNDDSFINCLYRLIENAQNNSL